MFKLRKPDPEKYCLLCGTRLFRKRFISGHLEDMGRFFVRKTCCKECQIKMQIKENAQHKQTMFSRARKHKKDHCEQCGSVSNLHIHHKDKNITNNSKENLVTLCRKCHDSLHVLLRQAVSSKLI